MPCLTVNSQRLAYTIEGEGFPLIMVPAVQGLITDWAPQMLLLGELCRVIAYEYNECTFPDPPAAAPLADSLLGDLGAVLDALAIERAYLAGYASGALSALHMALRCPERVEALLLIGLDHVPPEAQLRVMTAPTCVFVGEMAVKHVNCATRLTPHLPNGVKRIISRAAMTPHRDEPSSLAHAMLDFLMQCERQRNLVRGASFLL